MAQENLLWPGALWLRDIPVKWILTFGAFPPPLRLLWPSLREGFPSLQVTGLACPVAEVISLLAITHPLPSLGITCEGSHLSLSVCMTSWKLSLLSLPQCLSESPDPALWHSPAEHPSGTRGSRAAEPASPAYPGVVSSSGSGRGTAQLEAGSRGPGSSATLRGLPPPPAPPRRENCSQPPAVRGGRVPASLPREWGRRLLVGPGTRAGWDSSPKAAGRGARRPRGWGGKSFISCLSTACRASERSTPTPIISASGMYFAIFPDSKNMRSCMTKRLCLHSLPEQTLHYWSFFSPHQTLIHQGVYSQNKQYPYSSGLLKQTFPLQTLECPNGYFSKLTSRSL